MQDNTENIDLFFFQAIFYIATESTYLKSFEVVEKSSKQFLYADELFGSQKLQIFNICRGRSQNINSNSQMHINDVK